MPRKIASPAAYAGGGFRDLGPTSQTTPRLPSIAAGALPAMR